jgi:hypothetical protein
MNESCPDAPNHPGFDAARRAVRRIHEQQRREARWDWLLDNPELVGGLAITGAAAVLMIAISLIAWLLP